jgi:hypothetical protein
MGQGRGKVDFPFLPFLSLFLLFQFDIMWKLLIKWKIKQTIHQTKK